MKKGRRESVILAGIEQLCGRVRDFFAESLLLDGLSSAFGRCEQTFRTGLFSAISDAEPDRNTWKYRFRRACLHFGEKSRFARLSAGLGDALLSASVESYGCFGILFGGISSLMFFLPGREAQGMRSLLTSLIILIVSLPLLQPKCALSHAIRHSLLLGRFLRVFCLLPSDRFKECEEGKNRLVPYFSLAIILGGITYWIPSFSLLLFFLFTLLLALSFTCPELPILLLIGTLPFFNLFSHPTLLLCAGALFCTVAWFIKAFRGKRSLRFGLIDFCILLLSITYLFGGLVGSGGREGILQGVATAAVILFWFPASGFFGQIIWRRRAICFTRISSLFLALFGIFQYFFTDLELKWTDTTRFSDIDGRVCGLFSNPNIFAVYLLLTAPFFLIGIADESRGFWYRLRNAVGFLMLTLCTVLTWSRGAWLGLLVALLLFVLTHSRRSLSIALLSAPLLALAATYAPHNVLNRFRSIGLLSESSIRYRLYTWKGVLRMLRAHPFGIGTGEHAFHSVFPQYAISGTEKVMHAHHLFLQVLAELGLFGTLILGIFFVLLFLMAIHALKDLHGARRTEMLGGLCAIVATLVMGLFDYPWYHLGNCFLFFTVTAFLGAVCIGEDRFLCQNNR